MDALYAQLAEAIEKSNKSYDLPRIEAAYELAKKAHESQVRSSGDPYISHPIAVAVILVGLGMDSDSARFCTMWWRIPPSRWRTSKSSSAPM